MDKATRNNIQRTTQQARRLLEDEFREQLEGTFDILLDGTIAAEAGPHLSEAQRVTREKLIAVVGYKIDAGFKPGDAVASYLREVAFTTLNRFAALKMLEARELVQECVSKGEQSSGYREFIALAPGLVSLDDNGFRLYIETIFDEVGQEVRVLFDRKDVACILWPRRQALLALLELLNDPLLAPIWAEDETIGWIYQYFNADDERTRLRAESPSPRNTQELAVRNQFFTPRYVVQFLTDNTLGRTWYEMMQGETKLSTLSFLIRRPNEVFLGEQEQGCESSVAELGTRELLNQRLNVSFRAKKDPRDIRILDPACGSGHFLLYAFQLLFTIYEEAWADKDAAPSLDSSHTLRQDYPDLASFRHEIPGLILSQNLYGVDIDPRAAQIAALALWMRAQRGYRELGVSREARPQIVKTNIVVAEPIPGDAALVEEFAVTLDPPVLGELFKKIIAEMRNAGELGSLLSIEESLARAVEDAEIADRQGRLFAKGVNDPQFWDTAEKNILATLREFVESSVGAARTRRRLFSEDAAQGVALIELLRERFDVVLMNPPFGEATKRTADVIDRTCPNWGKNLACAFVSRARQLTIARGMNGTIIDNSTAIRSSYEEFRRTEYLSEDASITSLLTLGWGVLDAYVEVAAIVRVIGNCDDSLVIGANFEGVDVTEHSRHLKRLAQFQDLDAMRAFNRDKIHKLPNSVLDLDWPPFLVELFAAHSSLEKEGLSSYQGHALEAARHYRLFWELPPSSPISHDGEWAFAFKGGDYSPGYLSDSYVALVGPKYSLVPAKSSNVLRNRDFHFQAGVGYGKRGLYVDAQPLRASSFFTHEGMAFVSDSESERLFLLALINSDFFNFGINKYCGQHKQSGYVNLFPVCNYEKRNDTQLGQTMREFLKLKLKWSSTDETDYLFTAPAFVAFSQQTELPERLSEVERLHDSDLTRLEQLWDDMNAGIYRAYSIHCDDQATITSYCTDRPKLEMRNWPSTGKSPVALRSTILKETLSYLLGLAFRRFHPRDITAVNCRDALQDPFAPLPSNRPCIAPLPSEARIIVDDPGHPNDMATELKGHVNAVLSEDSDAFEALFCAEVGCDSIRSHFANPSGFFDFHLQQHSRGTRKAPIYWWLSTPSRGYSVWLSYHSLTRDTIFSLVNDYVAPKLRHEEAKYTNLAGEAATDPSKKQRIGLEKQEGFLEELRAFSAELSRVAPLWRPALDDGVNINFALLHRVVTHPTWQKECKKNWDKLLAGDYDWSHLAMHLWPERVVSKCATDHSLALAHGLEDIFWTQDSKGKSHRQEVELAVIDQIIKERTSLSVKAALRDLVSAPTLSSGPGAKSNRSKKKSKR